MNPLNRCILRAIIPFLLLPLPARADIHLFGSRETQSGELTPFTKWTGMLLREPPHRRRMRQDCTAIGSPCHYTTWMHLVEEAKSMPFENMLGLVNRQINEVPYLLDIDNWGLEDYWATPYEFFLRDGDCEDYAISKYMTLKIMGVSPTSMRIVVLQDHNLNLLHSVLVVSRSGRNYILDNQIQQVVTDSAIHHYEPIYSINEKSWWRHLPQ